MLWNRTLLALSLSGLMFSGCKTIKEDGSGLSETTRTESASLKEIFIIDGKSYTGKDLTKGAPESRIKLGRYLRGKINSFAHAGDHYVVGTGAPVDTRYYYQVGLPTPGLPSFGKKKSLASFKFVKSIPSYCQVIEQTEVFSSKKVASSICTLKNLTYLKTDLFKGLENATENEWESFLTGLSKAIFFHRFTAEYPYIDEVIELFEGIDILYSKVNPARITLSQKYIKATDEMRRHLSQQYKSTERSYIQDSKWGKDKEVVRPKIVWGDKADLVPSVLKESLEFTLSDQELSKLNKMYEIFEIIKGSNYVKKIYWTRHGGQTDDPNLVDSKDVKIGLFGLVVDTKIVSGTSMNVVMSQVKGVEVFGVDINIIGTVFKNKTKLTASHVFLDTLEINGNDEFEMSIRNSYIAHERYSGFTKIFGEGHKWYNSRNLISYAFIPGYSETPTKGFLARKDGR